MTSSATGRRYGGRSPAERLAERRARLLAAGLELFGTRGYAATTIEALCSSATVAPRYLYEQFPDREALLRAVYDEVLGHVRHEILTANHAAPAEMLPRMRAGVGALVGAMLCDERRARIVYFEVIGVSPALEAHRRAMLHAFRDVVIAEAQELIAAGELPDRGDLSLTAMALIGAANELLQDWLASDDRPPVEALVDTLVDVYAATLTGPPPRAGAVD
ncbi:MAG TPA: TetR/AcrR family transcriptional regulator [Solirubrobacteraceae bacterium]|nr:TetR/AcrR family transcriptional regulator [Solirubrobacteraceae bacterium]